MKRKPLDLEAIEKRCKYALPVSEDDIMRLVAALRRRPRVPAKLVRMVKDWQDPKIFWPEWRDRHGRPDDGASHQALIRAIQAEAKKGKGK